MVHLCVQKWSDGRFWKCSGARESRSMDGSLGTDNFDPTVGIWGAGKTGRTKLTKANDT